MGETASRPCDRRHLLLEQSSRFARRNALRMGEASLRPKWTGHARPPHSGRIASRWITRGDGDDLDARPSPESARQGFGRAVGQRVHHDGARGAPLARRPIIHGHDAGRLRPGRRRRAEQAQHGRLHRPVARLQGVVRVADEGRRPRAEAGAVAGREPRDDFPPCRLAGRLLAGHPHRGRGRPDDGAGRSRSPPRSGRVRPCFPLRTRTADRGPRTGQVLRGDLLRKA